MNVRRRLSHDGARRSLVRCIAVLVLLAAAAAPAPLIAQAKTMTVTAVTGLNETSYDEESGVAVYSVAFTVKNTGAQAAWVWARQDCGEWCGDGPAWSGLWTFLSPGQSATVPVWLSVPAFGGPEMGIVHLTVSGYLAPSGFLGQSDFATALVNLSAGTATLLAQPQPGDVITTPNGSTIALPAGWPTFNFVITNNVNNTYVPASVSLALRCGGFTGSSASSPAGGSCGEYDSSGNPIYNEETPLSATVFNGHPDTIPITLNGANGQRGYIRLIKSMQDPVTGAMVVDTASVLVVTGDQLMPQVTPRGTAVMAAPRYARVDSFTVRNTGTVTADYAISADCGSFSAGGCTASPSLMTIAAGGTARVAVAYTPSATNGATSVVKLIAAGAAYGVVPQRDTGSIVVTALDAAAPTITITPAQGATITARTFTATINVCDDGVVGNPVVTFNGVQLPDMFLRGAQSGCVTAGTSTFMLNAQTGTNTLVVTDADGYHTASSTRTFSYDDAPEATPQVAAIVSPVKVPPATAWTDTFTVKNPGGLAAQYALTVSCGAFNGCAAQPSTITVAPGATAKVAVAYSSPGSAGASATIQLTATHTSSTNHTVAASASLTATTVSGALPRLTMTPADGATYSTPTVTATVTWCDPDDAIATHQVWLGGVLLPDTFVPQSVAGCASAGTSTWPTLTLVPWDQLLLAQATDAAGHVTRLGHVLTYAPALAAYQPQVTPKNIQTTATRGVVNTQTFQVRNVGSLAATYQLAAACGAFTVCRVDKAAITVAPGARDSAHVSFLTPGAIGSFSPITLVARYTSPAGGGAADSGTVIASTPTAFDLYQPKVTAASSLMLVQPGFLPLLDYTIKNLGTETVTYTLTTTIPGDYAYVSWHMPIQSITLAPGASYVMDVQPRASTTANVTEAVVVRASYTASDGTTVSASDSSLVTTKDGIARLKITTISARNVTLSRGYGGDVDGAFAVRNVGTYPLSVSLSTWCSELLRQCVAPLATYVGVDSTTNVGVSFKVGLSPDAGTLRLVGVSGVRKTRPAARTAFSSTSTTTRPCRSRRTPRGCACRPAMRASNSCRFTTTAAHGRGTALPRRARTCKASSSSPHKPAPTRARRIGSFPATRPPFRSGTPRRRRSIKSASYDSMHGTCPTTR